MRQPLRGLMVWVVAGALGGLATEAIAQTRVGFLDVNGSFSTIAVPGAVSTMANGINNAGQIVGTYWDGNNFHGFLYSRGTFTTIDGEIEPLLRGATGVNGINETGQIVGSFVSNDFVTTPTRGFVYDHGSFTIFNVPGAPNTHALGINNSGQIVGAIDNRFSVSGFLYADGSVTPIDAPVDCGGCIEFTVAQGINDAGQIVGESSSSGFLYTGGIFSTFAMPDGTSAFPADINNAGQIVGTFRGGSFLYADGVFSIIDAPGSVSISASGINDAGDIVGTMVIDDVPEPGSLVFFSVGLLGLGLWRQSHYAKSTSIVPHDRTNAEPLH